MTAGAGTTPGPDPAALYAHATELARLGRLDEAARTLSLLLQRVPGHADAWNLGGIALGRDPHARATLRARVPAAVRTSGLFDPAAFARDLERLYAAMHAQRCAGVRATILPDR